MCTVYEQDTLLSAFIVLVLLRKSPYMTDKLMAGGYVKHQLQQNIYQAQRL